MDSTRDQMLADAAQFLISEVRASYAWKTNNLQHAWRVKNSRVEPEVVEWVRYVAQDSPTEARMMSGAAQHQRQSCGCTADTNLN